MQVRKILSLDERRGEADFVEKKAEGDEDHRHRHEPVVLRGEDPRDITRLWETLYSGTRGHYALREGRVTLQRAFGDVRDGDVYLVGAHIPEYAQGNLANHDPDRDRKLLLHRREISSLIGKVQERRLTLIPTRLYWKNGRVKVEIAVARGKEARDKRRDIAERDARRQIERTLKGAGRE